jgi:DNA polymerase III subunit alpha
MNKNYTILHLHSDLSNATTTMDSVTKYMMYIDRAKELGMSGICFTEHGNNFEWINKKKYCDKNGLKYIHGVEFYITKTIEEKKRDNYHCILIAKNYEGVKEINKLITISFNRNDGHFYFNPRITFKELCDTSENIIISSGCLGGMLRDNSEVYLEFIDFMKKNKHRCYLEIQPHPCNQQLEYNKKLIKIHNEFNIPILVTTDTHSLNKKLADGRIVLQKAKNIHFESEEEWNTVFMTYDEVLDNFNKQGFEFKDKILEGLNNTNLIKDMVEDFNLDTSFKYPKIYSNPKEEFKKLIKDGIKKRNVKINKKIQETIENEFKVLEKTMQIDYLLLVHRIVDWANSNNIYQGYGRGSICGSWLAYLLGITEMDSLKWNLNFFRYASPVRISIADVDLDWYEKDREKVLDYILKDKMKLNNLKTAKIITFNTINIKGGIRDVGRAFNIPLSEVSYICDNIENNEDELRLKYKELFEYVDILNGVIVSVGSHPAGAVISDKNIEEEFGLCTLSTSDCQVSCINMKEIDYLGFVKMDILGLDNVGVINETCKSIGIDRLTPDNTPSDDENIWKSISEDTTLIFQWESNSSSRYLKSMLSENLIKRLKQEDDNFSYIDWMSFGNGLIRPACESYRDSILTGDFYDNGLKELNDFLKSTRGRLSMQESIMQFLVEFCGYSGGESDEVRRAIGKKLNTESLVPEIESRFIEYTSKKYNISKEKCKEVIKPFIQVIIDASNYSFSWNHAKPYSWIGYVCGYLRYYYPLQTLTVALNIFYENEEKSNNIIKYIKNKTDIKIKSIRFGKSTSSYNFDKSENVIYKGMSAIKYISKDLGNELSILYDNKYLNFLQILHDLKDTSINSNQLEILIKLDYFSEFGKSQYLLEIVKIYEDFYSRKQISKSDLVKLNITSDIMERFCNKQTEKLYKEIDNDSLVKYLISELDDKDINLKEKLNAQKEYIGYIEYINEKLSDNFYYVLETKFYQNKTKPYLKLYKLKDGNTVDYRINEGFEFNTFKEGDIIKIIKEEKKNKNKLIDGKWTKIEGEFNNFIKSWQVL